MDYHTVLFDFDGVLSHDRFYSNLIISYPRVYNFIQTHVFAKGGEISHKWMKAEMNMDEVNRLISEKTGMDFETLTDLFIESVYMMRLDMRLLELAKNLVQQGKCVALVTDNMDVFNTVTIKNHNLDTIFPVIVNSCDHGMLKSEENGKLFDIALEKLGVHEYSNSLLIDDSRHARTIFEHKGGHTFAFEKYEQFEPWMKQNLV